MPLEFKEIIDSLGQEDKEEIVRRLHDIKLDYVVETYYKAIAQVNQLEAELRDTETILRETTAQRNILQATLVEALSRSR